MKINYKIEGVLSKTMNNDKTTGAYKNKTTNGNANIRG